MRRQQLSEAQISALLDPPPDRVKAGRWRILVGEDARRIDDLVRQSPERAYDVDFFESFATEVGWRVR